MNAPPYKFDEIFVTYIVRTCLVLALIHGAVHACLEESLCGRIRPRSNKFIEFINIALKIAPEKGRFAITLACTKLEFLTNEEHAFFVGLWKSKGVGR